MKVKFKYKKEKDIWCIINYGKTSFNSKQTTIIYQKIIEKFGEDINENKISDFIDEYLNENCISVEKFIKDHQDDWDSIADIYHKRAEQIFGIKLEHDIDVFFSINNRCPYSIENNLFFVSLSPFPSRVIVMHELWHFYTWYKFGYKWEKVLNRQKYNDIKEAFTVLLNIEYNDLLNGLQDKGYPQHKELREQIIDLWNIDKDVDKLWNKLIEIV